LQEYIASFKNKLSSTKITKQKLAFNDVMKKKTSEKIEEKSKKMTQEEYEKKVIKLAEDGLTAERIGEILRKEGIHPKEYKGKISEILKAKKAYINPDLKNVEKKVNRIQVHYTKNKADRRAMREKDRLFAQLRKLKKYFKV